MERGWFRVHRSLFDSKLWMDEPFTRGQAWVDMIGLANHKPGWIRKRGIRVDIPRGAVGYSERELAKRWKWSRGKVQRFLEELQKDLRIEPQNGPQKDNVTSCYLITNYEMYQQVGPQNDTTDGPQTGHRQDQNKNVKNEKNGKNTHKDQNTLGHEGVNGRFHPPSVEAVSEYIIAQGYSVDAQKWMDYYVSNGWRVGRNPMKDWKAAIRTWERNSVGKQAKTIQSARYELIPEITMEDFQ